MAPSVATAVQGFSRLPRNAPLNTRSKSPTSHVFRSASKRAAHFAGGAVQSHPGPPAHASEDGASHLPPEVAREKSNQEQIKTIALGLVHGVEDLEAHRIFRGTGLTAKMAADAEQAAEAAERAAAAAAQESRRAAKLARKAAKAKPIRGRVRVQASPPSGDGNSVEGSRDQDDQDDGHAHIRSHHILNGGSDLAGSSSNSGAEEDEVEEDDDFEDVADDSDTEEDEFLDFPRRELREAAEDVVDSKRQRNKAQIAHAYAKMHIGSLTAQQRTYLMRDVNTWFQREQAGAVKAVFELDAKEEERVDTSRSFDEKVDEVRAKLADREMDTLMRLNGFMTKIQNAKLGKPLEAPAVAAKKVKRRSSATGMIGVAEVEAMCEEIKAKLESSKERAQLVSSSGKGAAPELLQLVAEQQDHIAALGARSALLSNRVGLLEDLLDLFDEAKAKDRPIDMLLLTAPEPIKGLFEELRKRLRSETLAKRLKEDSGMAAEMLHKASKGQGNQPQGNKPQENQSQGGSRSSSRAPSKEVPGKHRSTKKRDTRTMELLDAFMDDGKLPDVTDGESSEIKALAKDCKDLELEMRALRAIHYDRWLGQELVSRIFGDEEVLEGARRDAIRNAEEESAKIAKVVERTNTSTVTDENDPSTAGRKQDAELEDWEDVDQAEQAEQAEQEEEAVVQKISELMEEAQRTLDAAQIRLQALSNPGSPTSGSHRGTTRAGSDAFDAASLGAGGWRDAARLSASRAHAGSAGGEPEAPGGGGGAGAGTGTGAGTAAAAGPAATAAGRSQAVRGAPPDGSAAPGEKIADEPALADLQAEASKLDDERVALEQKIAELRAAIEAKTQNLSPTNSTGATGIADKQVGCVQEEVAEERKPPEGTASPLGAEEPAHDYEDALSSAAAVANAAQIEEDALKKVKKQQKELKKQAADAQSQIAALKAQIEADEAELVTLSPAAAATATGGSGSTKKGTSERQGAGAAAPGNGSARKQGAGQAAAGAGRAAAGAGQAAAGAGRAAAGAAQGPDASLGSDAGIASTASAPAGKLPGSGTAFFDRTVSGESISSGQGVSPTARGAHFQPMQLGTGVSSDGSASASPRRAKPQIRKGRATMVATMVALGELTGAADNEEVFMQVMQAGKSQGRKSLAKISQATGVAAKAGEVIEEAKEAALLKELTAIYASRMAILELRKEIDDVSANIKAAKDDEQKDALVKKLAEEQKKKRGDAQGEMPNAELKKEVKRQQAELSRLRQQWHKSQVPSHRSRPTREERRRGQQRFERPPPAQYALATSAGGSEPQPEPGPLSSLRGSPPQRPEGWNPLREFLKAPYDIPAKTTKWTGGFAILKDRRSPTPPQQNAGDQAMGASSFSLAAFGLSQSPSSSSFLPKQPPNKRFMAVSRRISAAGKLAGATK